MSPTLGTVIADIAPWVAIVAAGLALFKDSIVAAWDYARGNRTEAREARTESFQRALDSHEDGFKWHTRWLEAIAAAEASKATSDRRIAELTYTAGTQAVRIAALENRTSRLEAQLRAAGLEPINGAPPATMQGATA